MTDTEKHDELVNALIERIKSNTAVKAIVGDAVINEDATVIAPCVRVSKARYHDKVKASGPQLRQADIRVESIASEDSLSALLVAVQYAISGFVGGIVKQCVLTDTGRSDYRSGSPCRADVFAVFHLSE